MNPKAYCIIRETTEDRFDETDSLEEAIRIAHAVARESQAGDLVSIEHRGRIIRQLVLLPDGRVAEEEIGSSGYTMARSRASLFPVLPTSWTPLACSRVSRIYFPGNLTGNSRREDTMASALAMVLMAVMVVPGSGPERVSAEMEQGLDLGSRWKGICKHPNGEYKVGMIGGQLADIRNNPPAFFSWPVIDEGKGRLRVTVAGQDCLGIYRQAENSLIIYYRDACKGYPASFNIAGTGCLLILHRVKPGK